MTNRATLLALASRVEAATATEQHEMLEAAFVAVHGPKPERGHGGSPEWHAWLDLHNPFFRKLAAEAYESATMSLVPSGWRWHSYYWPRKDEPKLMSLVTDLPHAGIAHGKAATPALAMASASLRAIAGSLTE